MHGGGRAASRRSAYLSGVGLADAVQAVEFAARLAARHHAGVHVAPGEVLQLVVDVEVPDAAVETGRVEGLRGDAQRGRQHLLRHAWTDGDQVTFVLTLTYITL